MHTIFRCTPHAATRNKHPDPWGGSTAPNFPCTLRVAAEDPARFNGDTQAWRMARVIPPRGTPAQTIRFAEEGHCAVCQWWIDQSGMVPKWLTPVTGYPVDMEYVAPGNGMPWKYEKVPASYWVFQLFDACHGSPVVLSPPHSMEGEENDVGEGVPLVGDAKEEGGALGLDLWGGKGCSAKFSPVRQEKA